MGEPYYDTFPDTIGLTTSVGMMEPLFGELLAASSGPNDEPPGAALAHNWTGKHYSLKSVGYSTLAIPFITSLRGPPIYPDAEKLNPEAVVARL